MNIWQIEVIRPVKREPFDHPEWLFEQKYDGFRALASCKDGKCILVSRHHNRLPYRDLEKRLATCIGEREVVLDGEVCSLDEKGRPVLADLISHRGHIVYVAFDVLFLDGEDLTEKPLLERKKMLAKFAKKHHCLQVGSYVISHGKEAFRIACEQNLEGIIAKPKDSIYKRGIRWYKIKNPNYKRSKPISHILRNLY